MAQFDTIHVPKQRVPSGANKPNGDGGVPISITRREHVVHSESHEAFFPIQKVQKEKKSQTWLWVLLAFVLLGSVGGLAFWYVANSQATTTIIDSSTTTVKTSSAPKSTILSPNSSATPAVVAENDAIAYVPPANWKNYYKGKYVGVSFYYPPELKIDAAGEKAPVAITEGVNQSTLTLMTTTVDDISRKLTVNESIATFAHVTGATYPVLSEEINNLSLGKTTKVAATNTQTVTKNGQAGYSFEYVDGDGVTQTEAFIPITDKNYLKITVKGSNSYLAELLKSISF